MALANDQWQEALVQLANALAASDGMKTALVQAVGTYLYNGGGPPLTGGVTSQLSLDRPRSLQGKGSGSGTITSTTAGDISLAFTSAPKTIEPGMPLRIFDGGFSHFEIVEVATSYVPTTSSTSIPLVSPVVNSGCTSADWEPFAINGPQQASFRATGVGLSGMALSDLSTGNCYLASNLSADGASPNTIPASASGLYNGATMDRQRGNLDNIALLASAARTTTQTPADQTNYNARGVIVCVDTTVVPGTAPSNVVTISGKDPVSGKYNTLLPRSAIAAVGTVFYTVYPGATAAANLTVSVPLPRTWQVKVTAGNANSATYSVGCMYIL